MSRIADSISFLHDQKVTLTFATVCFMILSVSMDTFPHGPSRILRGVSISAVIQVDPSIAQTITATIYTAQTLFGNYIVLMTFRVAKTYRSH